ncbi:hypothetical protein [Mongoliibacter ruber]|uniref:Erythromycin esterase n=1 Tax=Mongoliibacter ruber TaxID=1750599 RepID=A0A2T0WIK9_9BACT|nr:hypothetical protein [Mongoliibacter ruber]PRY86526.1 hypothetical protein CLW00_10813 [Mongoliibacter ruber]
MRLNLFLILLFISILGCSKNRGNQIIIDRDFENLSIIDKWVEGKEIVFLGEPTHGDGSIFTARIKIIVWLASAHALENPYSIVDPEDLKEIGQTYADMVTLGKFAKSHFGDKMLNLAFSAYQGSFYDFVDKKEIDFRLDSIPNLERNTIEKNMAITLVDLRKIDSVYYSGILGFEFIQANWGKNFDGVFIFPEVKASRRIE